MIISIIAVIFLFSIIIFVHEGGHFLFAKSAGIKIETFSLGFGPKLFSWKRGETLYQVCLIPFGGYVKMAGEEYLDKGEFEKWEYMGKPPGVRSRVIIGGSLNNLILGFLLLIPSFMIGLPGYDGTKIGGFVENMPAEKAGLKVGDEIVEINGKKCKEWFDVLTTIKEVTKKAPEKEINIKVKRNNKILQFNIKPVSYIEEALSGEKEKVYIIGILPKEKAEKYSFQQAVIRAGKEFYKMCYGVFLAFKMLIKKEVSMKLLSGPVGIAQWSAEIVHYGLSRYIYFIAFISINLGIINLFPIPLFDGGHLVGLFFEKITGFRAKRRFLEIVQYVGVLLLITLALYVTYNDILRVISSLIKK